MRELIEIVAFELGLDPDVLEAIGTVETALVAPACRYEPEWRYFVDPALWAKRLGQTFFTEKIQQATSWGPLQVMGSVARELGFDGHLSTLSSASVGLRIGAKKFHKLTCRYSKLEDAIASYNAGSPRFRKDGTYVNQEYVNKVLRALSDIQSR
jgi:hypothetical protein